MTTSDDTEKRVVTKPAAVVTNSKKGVSSISINKNLKDATHKLHSYGWRVKWIDGEQCLYKKLNPTFDVEVSGINNRKTKNYSVNVFVWEITPDIKIVDSYTELSSLDQVVSTLLEIEERYKQ